MIEKNVIFVLLRGEFLIFNRFDGIYLRKLLIFIGIDEFFIYKIINFTIIKNFQDLGSRSNGGESSIKKYRICGKSQLKARISIDDFILKATGKKRTNETNYRKQ